MKDYANCERKINDDTMMIYFTADLANVPPFMCSPFEDGWYYANNTADLIKYVLENIIATYLVNSTLVFSDLSYDDEEITLEKAINFYKNNNELDPNKLTNLDKFLEIFNSKKEYSYEEMSKLFCILESMCMYFGIDLKIESYKTPYDARHSENLTSDRFDYENLDKNFAYMV